MSLDAAIQGAVTAAIRAVGTTVTVRIVTAGAYDTATGTHTPSNSDTTLTGRLDNYSDRELQVGDGRILASDEKLTVSAALLATAPSIKDVVLIGGVTWTIKDVRRIIAQNAAAAYVLQLRR